jgi:hypothetical protein
MKRSLAVALAISMSVSLAPVASATQSPAAVPGGQNTPAVNAPVSSSDRDHRVARTCGDFCVDRVYANVELGAWFIDGENELLLAGRSTLKVVNTLTQKSNTVFTSPSGTEIDKMVLSENHGYALVQMDDDVFWRFDTSDWSKTDVTSAFGSGNPSAFTISNSGDYFYGAVGYTNAPIRKYNVSGLVESYTGSTNQGVNWLELTADDQSLYVGLLGAAPTVLKLDASDIAAGVVADDNGINTWVASGGATTPNGSVYATFSSEAGMFDPTNWESRLLKLNPSTLNVDATFELLSRWQGGAVTVSQDGSRVYGGFKHQGESQETSNLSRVYSISTGDFADYEFLTLDGVRDEWVDTLDADASGQYLVATANGEAFLIATSSVVKPSVALDFETNTISWDYSYVNPRAKFKWFEVKYRKAGSRKWTVKKVKRASTLTMSSEVAAGSNVIQVRAVYTKKSFNSSWGTFSIPV